MLATLDKSLKSQACDLFRLVQIYMSDRKPKPGMTLNSVGLDLVTICFNTEELRDELFVQICRQTTENHKRYNTLSLDILLLLLTLFIIPFLNRLDIQGDFTHVLHPPVYPEIFHPRFILPS